MRKIIKTAAGLAAFASIIAMFCFYFNGSDINICTICVGLFLTFLGVVSILSVPQADDAEKLERKQLRASREAREMTIQKLPGILITLGFLAGPTIVMFGLLALILNAITQPGSAMTVYVANHMFGGMTDSLDCAKSFLCGVFYCVAALTVICAIAGVAITIYMNWYRIKYFWKSRVKHEEVNLNE